MEEIGKKSIWCYEEEEDEMQELEFAEGFRQIKKYCDLILKDDTFFKSVSNSIKRSKVDKTSKYIL